MTRPTEHDILMGTYDDLMEGLMVAKQPPAPPAPPSAKVSGHPHNDPMEARVAKLESAMEYVQRDLGEIKADLREIKRDARSDFRLLFGALIAVALGISGLMAKGFGWL